MYDFFYRATLLRSKVYTVKSSDRLSVIPVRCVELKWLSPSSNFFRYGNLVIQAQLLSSEALDADEIRTKCDFPPMCRFGFCSSMCVCDVSEYLRKTDSKLFTCTQCPSRCLSHLLPPEKHHLGLCPRGHSYALPICPNNLCKRSFIPRRPWARYGTRAPPHHSTLP